MALGTHLALEKMSISKGGGGGRICNMASSAGVLMPPMPMKFADYIATKHGVIALSRFIGSADDFDAKKEGVKCYAFGPETVDTDLAR